MDQSPTPIIASSLAARLRHVRWLGGGSGAGKSTVARQLASDYGLRLYGCDESIAEHARRASPAATPLLQAFLAMDMDERWLTRTPEVMYQTFPWFQGEGFALILEDLLALPDEPLIVVEGFRLLPRLVAPLLSQPWQAAWLAPTPAFRRFAFDGRGFTWTIPNKTSNPQQALSNLLLRDQLFTEEVVRQAHATHLRVSEVDGRLSVAELAGEIALSLGLTAQ
jgi:hypothetical protein